MKVKDEKKNKTKEDEKNKVNKIKCEENESQG